MELSVPLYHFYVQVLDLMIEKSIKDVFELAYLSLSTDMSTCETFRRTYRNSL